MQNRRETKAAAEIDELWPGGPRFTQREDVFKLGTDAVLLAHFAGDGRARRAFDLGCGGGILPVLLAESNPALTVDCVDIRPEAAALTGLNADLNGLEARIRPACLDLRRVAGRYPGGGYDLVVCNPPYFPRGSGRRAGNEALADAREEGACTLEDICAAARFLLRWGGRLALVHRPERLAELMAVMSERGIEPKRLRLVSLTAEAAPILVLVEGRRGGNPGLRILPPLVLRDRAGGDSPEVRAIYHREA